MSDQAKNREELIEELKGLRRRCAQLEAHLGTLYEGQRRDGLPGTITDITDRKRADDALQESEERLRLSLEATQIGIWDWDVKTDQWYASPTYYTMLGYEPKTGWGDRPEWLERVHPEDRARVNEIIQNVLTGDFKEYQYEARLQHSDGTYRWQHVRGVSVKRDEDGKVTRMLGIRMDITQRKQAEEALRKSEAKYRVLIDNAPIGIVVSDVEGRILDVNRKLLEIVGSPSAEATKAINILTFPPLVEAELSGAFRRCLEEEVTLAEELPYTSKWGKRSHIRMLLTPMRDLHGKVYGCLATMEDVTERKRAEEALRVETERFRALIDDAPFGMVMIGADGTYQYVNPMFTQILGYDLSDIPNGKEWFRKAFPDAAYRHNAIAAWIEDTKKAAPFESMPRVFTVACKGGSERIINTRSVKLGQGDYLMTVEDITDLKRAEEALRRSEELYRTLVENMGVGISLVDSNYNIVMANTTLSKWLHMPASELYGKKCFEVFRTNESVCSDCPGVRAMKTGHAAESECNFVREGSPVVLRLRVFPLPGPNGVARGFVEVVEDITERKAEERERETLRSGLLQAQKMEAIGTLAGGIAHDFNNLLTVIMGFTEFMLAERNQNHPEYADLKKIFHAAKSGADLVQRLLTFSRASESKPVPMNLNTHIVQIEQLLRRTIPKMIDIRLDLSSDLPDINADPSQIEQVLLNLAVNARDAMPDGGKLGVRTEPVTLDEEYCRLHGDANPGEYVLLELSDTGRGMDQQTLQRIFEPFFTTKEIGRGTGLGLAMVHGMVQQHNGHVAVASKVGKGTAFKVYFPAIPAEVQPPADDGSIVPSPGNETILLVEDEEFVRELGARILTKYGYAVIQAVNGAEALELFKRERHQISLVILDLMMPEMGGTECLKELLKIDPQVNILFASGYSADASQREIVEMGAKGFVTKPFRVKELLRGVRRALDLG